MAAAADRSSPRDSFLLTFPLAFFTPSRFRSGIFSSAHPLPLSPKRSPSKRPPPLNTYLSYAVVIMAAKSRPIEYSLPRQTGGRPNTCLFYYFICGFISMNGVMWRGNPDNTRVGTNTPVMKSGRSNQARYRPGKLCRHLHFCSPKLRVSHFPLISMKAP